MDKVAKEPEKLWLAKDTHGVWVTNPDSTRCVECTRTDAFMKKAENFLEMLGYGFTITDNITHANYDKEQLIEDFRNYMEGE